jgi:hypothetical protein
MKRAFAVAAIAIAIAMSTHSERAVADKTTDASDLWWIPTESGWGIQLVQQETTIFATMFVYGPNKQPTWYVGLLSRDTPTTFTWTGTLYATTGPWFGTVPFDPATTTAVPVGERCSGREEY